MSVLLTSLLVLLALAGLRLYVVARSIVVIGPAEAGLLIKRVSSGDNTTDTAIAFARPLTPFRHNSTCEMEQGQ